MFANQKGGVGKSVASYNYGFFLAEKGKRVLFIDSDTQGNSSSSLRNHLCELKASQFFEDAPVSFRPTSTLTVARADDGMKNIERLSADMGAVLVKRIKARLAEAEKHFDYCVIDTPGSNTNSVGALMFCATHIIIPTEIDSYSIQVAVKMLQRIIGVQKEHNKGLVNLGLLPSRLKPGAANQRRDLEGLLRDYSQYVLRAILVDRMAYKDAADEGVPVWKYTKRQKRDDWGKPVFDEKGNAVMERVSDKVAGNEMQAAFELILSKIEG